MGKLGIRPTFFMQQTLLEEIKKRVGPLLKANGMELVDLFISRGRRRSLLRFLVDKPTGITLDECARLNQEISRFLDEENIVQESYVLEVSSPGLDRPMKNTRDFQRCLGQIVKIALHQPLNGQNVWIGFMDGVDEENIIIRAEQGERVRIARKDIAWAKLEIKVS